MSININIHPNRKRWINRRLIWLGGILVVLFLFAAAYEMKKNGEVRETIVEITDLEEKKFISERDVIDWLRKKFSHTLQGKVVSSIDVEKVESELEKNPYVENAEVYIDALNRANISITQAEPIVRVYTKDGNNYYLDEKGKFIPGRAPFAARVVVTTGETGSYNENYHQVKDHRAHNILLLAKKLKSEPFWDAFVEQIYVEPSGDFVLVPSMGSMEVEIGSLDNLDNKLQRIITFYKEGLPVIGWNVYRRLSVKYKDQVVGIRE